MLTPAERQALRDALAGRHVVVCFGGGVDSTAMLVALYAAGIVPGVIGFADTGGEKPETLAHVDAMSRILETWGWPPVTVVRKTPLPSTGYADLFGNCLANETLPSLAFGMKSCSIKWKQGPQDQWLKGVKSGPNARPAHPMWLEAKATGQRILKLIGYDCGPADRRRSGSLASTGDDFDYAYPLQLLGWERRDCIRAIAQLLGPERVPIKSACFFCPASKAWELFWLAAHHPDLMERALQLERVALTGRHSRFDEVEFGDSWEALVKGAERFPSSRTTVGLGRSFAWNHWARINDVVDDAFRVRRGEDDRARFLASVDRMRDGGNALDARGEPVRPGPPS
ncbi:hypothetical protein RhoFW510R10_12025 [Rhodanobacter sp. FW510-R10]|nr:hypothetical protein RhoFW510R10_12025 [Rhodanobacter sp. FW510-R10]